MVLGKAHEVAQAEQKITRDNTAELNELNQSDYTAVLTDVKQLYGRTEALKGVCFALETGSIVGFLGRNGAGKTTTLRILSGFAPPSSGKVEVFGMEYGSDFEAITSRLGYLPEKPPLYPDMLVFDYLMFCGQLKGMTKSSAQERIEAMSDEFGLEEVIDKHCFKLSKGYRQRVGLAQAFIHEPDLVLLDEPTAGLDPEQTQVTREIIKSNAGQRTILLSSHLLSEVQQTCSRIIIIDDGEILADNTQAALSKEMSRREISCEITLPDDKVEIVKSKLFELSPNSEVKVTQKQEDKEVKSLAISLPAESTLTPENLSAILVENGAGIRTFSESKLSLEEIFLKYIEEKRSHQPM